MKMTTEEARNLGIKAIENCSNTEPDAAFQIIADAIFYACQDEADSLQAAVAAEREACAEAVVETEKRCNGDGMCHVRDEGAIRARGTTLQTPEGKEGQ